MRKFNRQTGKARSVPAGMAIGGTASMMTTFLLSAVIAHALNSERITWEQAGYWIMFLLFISSFIGSKSAAAAIKRQRIIVSVMAGVLYWGILLCITALFFGGNFDAVGVTAGIILAGCGTAALITLPKRKKLSPKYRGSNR